MSHVTRKPVFGSCDKVRQKPVCSATEASKSLANSDLVIRGTPESLYNTVPYNPVLDITRVRVGPQMAFSYITFTFYSRYNMVWKANTEIGLDPNNSVIKRLNYLGSE